MIDSLAESDETSQREDRPLTPEEAAEAFRGINEIRSWNPPLPISETFPAPAVVWKGGHRPSASRSGGRSAPVVAELRTWGDHVRFTHDALDHTYDDKNDAPYIGPGDFRRNEHGEAFRSNEDLLVRTVLHLDVDDGVDKVTGIPFGSTPEEFERLVEIVVDGLDLACIVQRRDKPGSKYVRGRVMIPIEHAPETSAFQRAADAFRRWLQKMGAPQGRALDPQTMVACQGVYAYTNLPGRPVQSTDVYSGGALDLRDFVDPNEGTTRPWKRLTRDGATRIGPSAVERLDRAHAVGVKFLRAVGAEPEDFDGRRWSCPLGHEHASGNPHGSFELFPDGSFHCYRPDHEGGITHQCSLAFPAEFDQYQRERAPGALRALADVQDREEIDAITATDAREEFAQRLRERLEAGTGATIALSPPAGVGKSYAGVRVAAAFVRETGRSVFYSFPAHAVADENTAGVDVVRVRGSRAETCIRESVRHRLETLKVSPQEGGFCNTCPEETRAACPGSPEALAKQWTDIAEGPPRVVVGPPQLARKFIETVKPAGQIIVDENPSATTHVTFAEGEIARVESWSGWDRTTGARFGKVRPDRKKVAALIETVARVDAVRAEQLRKLAKHDLAVAVVGAHLALGKDPRDPFVGSNELGQARHYVTLRQNLALALTSLRFAEVDPFEDLHAPPSLDEWISHCARQGFAEGEALSIWRTIHKIGRAARAGAKFDDETETGASAPNPLLSLDVPIAALLTATPDPLVLHALAIDPDHVWAPHVEDAPQLQVSRFWEYCGDAGIVRFKQNHEEWGRLFGSRVLPKLDETRKGLVIVGSKDAAAFAGEILASKGLGDRVAVAYVGAIESVNNYGDVDTAITFGPLAPPKDAIRVEARVVDADPDATDEIWEARAAANLIQALARARAKALERPAGVVRLFAIGPAVPDCPDWRPGTFVELEPPEGGRPRAVRPREGADLLELARVRAGGVAALAEELDVSERTLWRWQKAGPPKDGMVRIRAYLDRTSIAAAFAGSNLIRATG